MRSKLNNRNDKLKPFVSLSRLGNQTMAYFDFNTGESDNPNFFKMMDFLGPGHIDGSIRQAIQSCWMILPNDKKNPDELEVRLRHIFDRAIANFREDFNNLTPPRESDPSPK